jgi:hypothetical protein
MITTGPPIYANDEVFMTYPWPTPEPYRSEMIVRQKDKYIKFNTIPDAPKKVNWDLDEYRDVLCEHLKSDDVELKKLIASQMPYWYVLGSSYKYVDGLYVSPVILKSIDTDFARNVYAQLKSESRCISPDFCFVRHDIMNKLYVAEPDMCHTPTYKFDRLYVVNWQSCPGIFGCDPEHLTKMKCEKIKMFDSYFDMQNHALLKIIY